jgi:trehalose synthase
VIEEIEVDFTVGLDEYAEHALLAPRVEALRAEAHQLAPKLSGRTVWMVNSTARGGGIAEMLPKMVHLLGELGVKTRWVVIQPDEPAFFSLTKRIHNAIHGVPGGDFGPADRQLYDKVSRQQAAELGPMLKDGDILVVHDPQPAGMGAILKRERDIKTIWRCHIGLDQKTDTTRQAWGFLAESVRTYDYTVFSAPAYITPEIADQFAIIKPAIDPLGHKNRHLHPVKLSGILSNAGLLESKHPVLTPPFDVLVSRLTPDGNFEALDGATEVGLMFRPVVTQISRWDRLKGWFPLLAGFRQLKANVERYANGSERSRRRLEVVRLVLAGPEPSAVADDPEASDVLEEIRREYMALPPEMQANVAVLSLPMASAKHNALIVNALQRASSIIVQNSLREGFGLSVTEAMWKRTPVIGSSAYGIRRQITAGIDGELIDDPSNPGRVADALARSLNTRAARDKLARQGHYRAVNEFLIFRQLSEWIRLLVEV